MRKLVCCWLAGLTSVLLIPASLADVVNGCDPATAQDFRAQSQAVINFTCCQYTPKCVRIKAGDEVKFNGDFLSHPMRSGTSANGNLFPDNNGPFFPPANTGTTRTYTIAAVGQHPFYCEVHGGGVMNGVVYVGDFGLLGNVIFESDFE